MWKCKCGEMNPDGSSFCQSCGDSRRAAEFSEERMRLQQKIAREESEKRMREEREESEKRRIEIERKNRERIQQEYNYKIDNLSKMGLDGYYEYKVVRLQDDNAGGIHPGTLESRINELGLDGWRLRCAYTNELGRNSNSGGYGGFSTGTNSTIDDNILIFERFVKIDNQ